MFKASIFRNWDRINSDIICGILIFSKQFFPLPSIVTGDRPEVLCHWSNPSLCCGLFCCLAQGNTHCYNDLGTALGCITVPTRYCVSCA